MPHDSTADGAVRLSDVLEDVISRRLAGEALSDEAVIAAHRGLMPELEAQLRELRRVDAARLRAGSSAMPPLGRGERTRLAEDALPGYRVIREIHRGGQGVVYLALQESTQREVAVKVMREGPFAGPRDEARFEREVRILAQLQHPNIVAIHDGGRAPGGQFFFVMDYVRGESLDEFLARTPALRARLAMFAAICEAVHAAHLRGVIHRDLKPSNIRIDEAGRPRILDFGLARVTDEADSASASSDLTLTGQFVGSLPWASPEQAHGTAGAIDVRTDVYSLGVILYQMLTGRFPYDVTGGLRLTLDHIVGTQPVRARLINPAVDADVETIALKCLAKEPERRYQGAGEVAREVEHYLADEPIEARRDSTGYVLRKLLGRHQAATAAGIAFVLLIGASIIALSVLYRGQVRAAGQARREARKAERTTQFLRDMLASVDPNQARGREVTVRQVLAEAEKKLESSLGDEPQVAAAMHGTLGQTYSSLGDFKSAERHYRAAYDLAKSALGPEHPDTLAALNGIASEAEALNRYDEAEQMYRQCLEAMRRVSGPAAPETLDVAHNLANLLANRGRYDEAEALLQEVLAASIRILGPEDPATLVTRKVLAGVWQSQGKFDLAEPELRAVLEIQRRVVGSDSPETMGTAQYLAMLLKSAGRPAEAEPLLREVVEVDARVLGARHPDTLRAQNSLGRLLAQQGKTAEAEEVYRRTLAVQREVLGEEHTDTLISMNNLSLLLQDAGRLDEAEPLARTAEEVGRRVLGDDHPDALVWMNNYANLLSRQGRFADAEQISQKVLEGRRRVLGERHPATLMAMGNLGYTLTDLGRFDEADALLSQALALRRDVLGPDHPETLMSMNFLSRLRMKQGRWDEAESLARETLVARTRAQGADHPDTIQAAYNLGMLLVDRGSVQQADEVLRPALARAESKLPASHWVISLLHAGVGRCDQLEGRIDEAEGELLRGFEGLSRNPGVENAKTQQCIGWLVEFYEARGNAERAATYRAKLKPPATSQPVQTVR